MKVVRVTQVLDYFQPPNLVAWKLRTGNAEANRISRAAMKTGSRVDEIIKANLEPVKKDKPEVFSAFIAYKKWLAIYIPLEVKPQVRVEKEIEGIILSGEPDIIVIDDIEPPTLVDIKVATRISDKYWLQLAAYAWLTDWTGPVGILRLDKATESYEYVTKNLSVEWAVYCGLLKAYLYYGEDDNGAEL